MQQLETWKHFRDSLYRYAEQPRDRRAQLLFRGQSHSSWALTTTLDRDVTFADDKLRNEYVNRLLHEFQRELVVLTDRANIALEGDALELLARHHGLPSQLLDWTHSPYIAAYFAFEGRRTTTGGVTIWVLDRAKLPSHIPPGDVIDDRLLLRLNRKAIQQRSSFLRVSTIQVLDGWLGDALFRFDISAADRDVALADLDEMNINATTLFSDLDGAARTVSARMKA